MQYNISLCTLIAVALSVVSCQKKDTASTGSKPTIETVAISAITPSSATSGGNITYKGTSDVTQRGICWKTTSGPTIANNRTTDGAGSGNFTSTLSGLAANTTYYVKAYAINSTDTAYGNELTFTTGVVTAPVIATKAITNIRQISAQSGGDITSDGGAAITAKGICWNTSANPTTANSKTIDGSGSSSFVSTLAGIIPATTYYVRAYATNNIGTTYGTQVSFSTQNLTMPGSGVTDADGNNYTTVVLGDKEWMNQNLRVTKYRNGDVIPNQTTATAWQNTGTSGAWCYYNNTTGYNNTYGKLYNWYAATDARQLCPTGWHVPSAGEWTVLEAYLGGNSVAGGLLKDAGYSNWASPNTGATNSSGFTALPGGIRDENGSFGRFGQAGTFESTDGSTYNGTAIYLYYGSATVEHIGYWPKQYGVSVRCVKD